MSKAAPLRNLKLYEVMALTSGLFPAVALAATASLEEVVVSAQRRMETVQEVPIAISAFTENYLTDVGVTSTSTLAMVTPGLNFTTQLAGAVPFIRGIGNPGTSAGQDSSVSTYVDDVYYSASVGSVLSFNNIERVEVLKGPQGTLFGRNATGGLVHIITKTPAYTPSGEVQLSYGNYDTSTASFYGTSGITDTIAADLAVYYSHQGEGWGTNLATGNDNNKSREQMVRSKWLIEPADNLQITLGGDYSEVETSKGLSARLSDGALGPDGLLIFAGLTTPIADGGFGLSPTQAAPIAAAAAQRHTGDFYDTNANIDPLSTQRLWGGSAKIEWQLDDIDIESITAYRQFTNTYVFSQDQVAMPNLLEPVMPEFDKTFTQELKASGSTDNLDWIAGAYFLHGEAGYDNMRITGLFLSPLDRIVIDDEQETTSWALFGQSSYAFTDSTKATLGLRYTEDKRDLTGNTSAYAGGFLAAGVDYDESKTFRELTYRLGLDHNLTDSTLLYFSYNRGFKSGVYNLVVSNPVTGSDAPVEPEILDAYEIGIKSDLLDSRLRVNAALFYYDFQDLQASVVGTGASTLINAAEATMQGGEIEITGKVADGLTLNLGVAYLDAEYDSFPLGPTFTPTGFGGNAAGSAELKGNEIPRAPEFTATTGATYELTTTSGTWTANVNYYYNSGFYWEPENRLEQESYSLVNATLGWADPSDTYSVQLFGNNLGDEEYVAYGTSGTLGDNDSAAPPRTYGVKVGYKF